LQTLCNRIEEAETRKDARTAREIKASLPNELPYYELVRIVDEFVETNFKRLGLPAIAAIHKGINIEAPDRNNPHVHLIVPTRTVCVDGFSKEKYLPLNAREYIRIWRSHWAEVQNRAYERRGLDVRVSHKSLKDQNKEREPVKYIPRLEYVRDRDEITAEREAAKEARAHVREKTRSVPEIDREK
jgi:ATP-dependent exoDNAse (exonuclease V) alpha subunit